MSYRKGGSYVLDPKTGARRPASEPAPVPAPVPTPAPEPEAPAESIDTPDEAPVKAAATPTSRRKGA